MASARSVYAALQLPPYSVGEAGQVGLPAVAKSDTAGPVAAWRQVLLPSADEFPTLSRVVSEITESNGSSSMASGLRGLPALMAAGVPLKAPVAGITPWAWSRRANQFAVLTDILGDEDHLGDMGLSGSRHCRASPPCRWLSRSPALQQIMEVALQQAQTARLHILGQMNQVLATARTVTSENAPSMVTLKVDSDKIRDIIGKGRRNYPLHHRGVRRHS